MADDQEQSKSFHFPWPGLLLACAVALGFWIVQPPLTSSRGSRTGVVSESMFGEQTADARLWQDPFEVVERHQESAHHTNHPFSEIVHQVNRRIRQGRQVKLMTVMLAGGPYSEDSESRLRTRRAMVAALGRNRWVPADATHIGLFDFHLPTILNETRQNLIDPAGLDEGLTDGNHDSAHPPLARLTIPYEWFRPTMDKEGTHGTTDILIWWLSEPALSQNPLMKLGLLDESLRSALRQALPDNLEGEADRIAHHHFGPRSSDSLKAMVDELHALETKPPAVLLLPDRKSLANVWPRISIFSCWATASEAWLKPGHVETNAYWTTNVWSLRAQFHRHRIPFTNVITRDDCLVAALMDELKLRNVPLERPDLGVALISEYDTFYGRAFSRTFRQQVLQRRLQWARDNPASSWAVHAREAPPLPEPADCATNTTAPLEEDNELMETVHQFGYLRGLDGEMPSGTLAELAAAREAQGRDAGSQRTKLAAQERAEKRGQFDYLLRLSHKLLDRDHALRTAGEPGIRAIGVLGSDLHDKLIVLQALRPYFPQAVFFTTDLDARLSDPMELKWTRNLVVSGGYGLEVKADLQRPVSSFRDGYQTALFTACLAAVGDSELPLDRSHLPPEPMIFEIGKTSPVCLKTNALSSWHQTQSRLVTDAGWSVSLTFFLAAFCGLLFALFLILAPNAMSHFRQELANIGKLARNLTGQSRWRKAVIYFVAAHVVLLPAWYVWQVKVHASSPHGEPLYWLEGVSVWPTEFLRLLVAYLCLGFCIWTRIRVMKNKQELVETYSLPQRIANKQDFHEWCDDRLRQMDSNSQGKPTLLTRWQRHLEKKTGAIAVLAGEVLYWCRVALLVRINNLGSFGKPSATEKETFPAPKERSDEDAVDASDVWRDYNGMGFLHSRLLRVIPCVILYFLIGVVVMTFWGFPFLPLRGAFIAGTSDLADSPSIFYWLWHPPGIVLDQIALWASLLALWLLIFFVLDATLLCRQFIRTLTKKNVGWAESTYRSIRARFKIPKYYLEEWIDMQVIAKRTSAIMPLIYFPFLTLSIFIFSRSTIFDAWDWPLSLIILTALNGVFVLIAAWLLRGAAEDARQNCIQTLQGKMLELMGEKLKKDPRTESKLAATPDAVKAQVEKLLLDIRHMRSGAFAPLSEQALVKALLLPFGGAGALFFLDALSYM